ncbi:OST-HTH/LOTUS domain [Fragilaria crotonensis]|nr:OST-HTH/LOTUS domain [Fragilaria crotonensis]
MMKLPTVCRAPLGTIMQRRGWQSSSFSSEVISSHPIQQTYHPKQRHSNKKLNYAILIDADHGQHRKMRLILDEIHALDVYPSVRRAYGDFTIGTNSRWRDACQKYSIVPIHAYSFVSGKATTDLAMMIDAMDLLYTNPDLDGFVIMSGDSDFCRLAQRLREAGKHVIGVGGVSEYHPFPRSCNVYICSDKLLHRKPPTVIHESVVVPATVEPDEAASLEMLPPPPPMEVNAVEKESSNISILNSWIPQRVLELWNGTSSPDASAKMGNSSSTTDVVEEESESLDGDSDDNQNKKSKSKKKKKKKSRRRRK